MQIKNKLLGVGVVAFFAIIATFISTTSFFEKFGISPLIIGIILGVFYANCFQKYHLKLFDAGIVFSTKTLLRIAIVFYGFRLTFHNIYELGYEAVIIAIFIIVFTFLVGYFIGVKLLKMDKDLVILTSAGSSICGAAAVLATESTIKAKAYKSTVAVSTVVIFGTLAMFLYPFLYQVGVLNFSPNEMGVYIGATLHEVAHVVAASNAVEQSAANSAVIVKMIRVMMLAPFLFILGLWYFKFKVQNVNKQQTQLMIPWFAVYFIVVIGFNSLGLLSNEVVAKINYLDTFALTMAMTALGMETKINKFKQVGLKPFYLASILFVWLISSGYFLIKILY